MPKSLTPKFRERTYGRDLRRDYPEKDRIEALCRRAIRARKGHVLFLAGPRLSGRSDLLQTLGEHVGRRVEGVKVCASKFLTEVGRFEDVASNTVSAEAVGKTILSAMGELLSGWAAQLIKATNEILKGYLEGRRALSARESASLLQRSIDELEIHLQREAAAGPVVWLIDDFDRGNVEFMRELLYGLRAKLADRLPVIFVLTVEGRGTLEPDPAKANALQSLAGSLVVNSVGSWMPVRPLSRVEIVYWLGQTAPDIIEKLLRVSGGYPPQVIETWRHWQAGGYIVHDPAADMWRQANPEDDLARSLTESATRKFLRDHFPDDTPEEHDQWHLMLQLCASEGETFTADCVADAIEWDRDEMQDFLDDFFVRNDDTPDGQGNRPIKVPHS